MFNRTRFKLTAWYILIIFLISTLFSVAFYQVSTREVQRMVNRMRVAQEEWRGGYKGTPPPLPPNMPSLAELQTIKRRFLINLVVINGLILVITGGAAYFLAGKTLAPIKLMIDEQNRFITDSSHELRTPLASLRAEMEGSLLEKRISDTKARRLIKSNLEEITRLQTLSNRLLQLATNHNLPSDKYSQRLSLKTVIAAAVKRVQVLADAKQITIKMKLSRVTVNGSQEKLIELFAILIDNAIKYSTPQSQVKIVSQKKKNSIVVSVTDKGVGISRQDLPHIFDRFYRSDQSRFKTDGFGLGLSIAKQIASKHHGAITATSQVGKGTTLIVSLPLAQS
jgi:two-component system sensor histidine kinase CiaH